MKTLPSRGEVNKVLKHYKEKSGYKTSKKSISIKKAAMPLFNCLYLNFMKDLAKETETMMYLDNQKRIKPDHIHAASKKVLPNYNHTQAVRRQLPNYNDAAKEASSSEEEEEADD